MKLYEMASILIISTAIVMITALFQADKDTRCGAAACIWCKNIVYECDEVGERE